MILLFAFLGGLFFNQLNIFKNIKIFFNFLKELYPIRK